MEIESQKCVSESQKWDSSLYTDLKTFSYSSDGQNEKKEKIPDSKSNTDDRNTEIKPKTPEKLTTAKVSQNLTAKSLSQGKEKSSAARRTKKRTKERRGFNWLPDGPWNIDEKLDPNFRDWLAKNWVKRYGGDFHDKQADVLAHFRKDPANLAIRWEQYQNEFVHRVENTQIRLANGCQINEVQQNNLITHQRAVTAALSPEMNPVAVVAPVVRSVLSPVPEKVTRGLESVEQVAGLTPSKNSDCEPSLWDNDSPIEEVALANQQEDQEKPADEYTKLEDGTRLKVFKRKEEPEPTAESPKSLMDMVGKEAPKEGKQLREMVHNFLKGFGGNGDRQVCPKPKSELEELNEWLLQPGLREEAINRARRSPNYKYCYDIDQIIVAEDF